MTLVANDLPADARVVDIGVFAHDEASGIAAMIAGLAGQDIFARHDIAARVVILANGCADATAVVARSAIAALPDAAMFTVENIALGGKSRTWNTFTHDVSRSAARILIFCDADIVMPRPDTLSRLVDMLDARPELAAANSLPIKDIALAREGLSRMDRLIVASGGGLDDWRTAICGQLYALRATVARDFHLPIGLPVEDGFVRAMVLTNGFAAPEDPTRIDGDALSHHVYASERGLVALIRHQIRIVIGGAINAAVFAHLRALPTGQIRAELAAAARDETWLARVMRDRLPAWPNGWVPLHFLTKRMVRASQAPRVDRPVKSALVLAAGFGFDLVVYALAQIKMARGIGAGHW